MQQVVPSEDLDDHRRKIEERQSKHRAFVEVPSPTAITENERTLWFRSVMRFTSSVCHFTELPDTFQKFLDYAEHPVFVDFMEAAIITLAQLINDEIILWRADAEVLRD